MATGCVIGVDLGGTKLLAGAVDAGLTVRHRATRAAPAADGAGVVERVAATIEEVREAVESAAGAVEAVGLGIPCLIDAGRGVAGHCTHLPLAGLAVGALVAERAGLPVFVDNDANLAMLAEWRHGAARGARDAVLLTIGTGIGGALVVDGGLRRGALGAGAELGHMVVQADGPPCNGSCPSRGCLEAMVSGTALAREARRLAAERPDSGLGRAQRAGRELSGALVTELAHDGDAASVEALEVAGGWLGVGISNLVNMLNPDVVVVAGGVMAAGELLLAPARAVVAERALPPSREHVRVLPARFGVEAGMLGAALLALDRIGAPA